MRCDVDLIGMGTCQFASCFCVAVMGSSAHWTELFNSWLMITGSWAWTRQCWGRIGLFGSAEVGVMWLGGIKHCRIYTICLYRLRALCYLCYFWLAVLSTSWCKQVMLSWVDNNGDWAAFNVVVLKHVRYITSFGLRPDLQTCVDVILTYYHYSILAIELC